MDDQDEVQSPEERMQTLLDNGLLEEPNEDPEDEQEARDEDREPDELEETEEKEVKEEPATIKLKWNGEEIEKPLEEVVALAQQGHDYTQKTQKLAEERRQVEEQAQAVKAQEESFKMSVQVQQSFLKELAAVKAIEDQIEAYAKIDWQGLSDSDPVQAQKLFITYSQLQNQKQQAVGTLNAKHQEALRLQAERHAKQVAEGNAELPKLIPDFNESVASDLQQFAKTMKSDIASSLNPNDYKVLWMARQYAKLQESKPQVTNKVASKPSVVKPGGTDAKSMSRTNNDKARQQLRQSGRMEDAAKILARLL